jgi:hypothetical protein
MPGRFHREVYLGLFSPGKGSSREPEITEMEPEFFFKRKINYVDLGKLLYN